MPSAAHNIVFPNSAWPQEIMTTSIDANVLTQFNEANNNLFITNRTR